MKNKQHTGAGLRRAGGAAFGLYRFLLLAGLSVIILYPVLYSVSLAVRAPQDLYDPLVILIPRNFTWDNLKNAFSHLEYAQAFPNSMVLVLTSTVLQVASCALVGYGLARYRFKGRGLIFAMVILTIVVPPQTVIIPNYMNFRYFDPLGLVSLWNMITGQQAALNLINTNLAFYLPAALGMGIRSGLIIFIFRQFFRGMPRDLEEAAYIDGCGPVRGFFRIMLPNAGPAFLTGTLFSIVWYWNDYVYTSNYLSNTKTVMNQLYRLYDHIGHIMEYEMNTSPYEGILLLQAGVLLAILPPLLLYVFLQRYFVESIERSGIVG